MIKLDILSDPICPWCYIGKANLDAALKERPGHPFTFEWHPFQLNPDMPAGGMGRRDYLETKFGGRENAVKVYAQIEQAAQAAGLDIDFARIETTPNTLDAHRLIHWAGLEGRQTAAVAALFSDYFTQGRDIGDRAVLLDVATRIGLDREMTERLMESDADASDIKVRDAHARARGVTGVPTFVVGQQHVMPGAQPPELWVQVIDELMDQVGSGAQTPDQNGA
ncbi:DsbA family oxidoreductase [Profundibacterium mesophilum]|uniref:Polyketide biosynthesis associated protein n=1 Tax=Profundibacterium mesophilum KAUST100406-0324 TaxID=1037889 RepID=A0A921NPU6_9RHOB|nr:DsbA family oxidoreductase [Profundibacterium mesophilum]KAF0674747.1 Polyketide biosynthesis associated protein [Profundibacterium mesophilum KAUST100406-0324]